MHETNPTTLIRRVCELLVESRGVFASIVVLTDDGLITRSAHAGVLEKLRAVAEMLSEGKLPACIGRAMDDAAVVVKRDASAVCTDCPVNANYAGSRDVVVAPISLGTDSRGALLVSLTPGLGADSAIVELVTQLADDIAHTLRRISSDTAPAPTDEVIEESRAKIRELHATVEESETSRRAIAQSYRALFEHASLGIAHCQMLFDGDDPRDFIYLDVNPAFGELTGLTDVVGRKVSSVIPGIRDSDPQLFEIHGRVARTGNAERFEIFVQALDTWFDVSVYCPQHGHFIAVFDVITERKQVAADLRLFSERLEGLTRVVQELSRVRDVASIVDIVRRASRALVGADGASFVLRDGDRCHYVDEDAIGPLWRGMRFPISTCISGWVMLNREAAVIPDVYEDDRIPHEAYRKTFVHSLAMVPIRSHDPLGAIGCYWAEPHTATTQDVRILQALADSTSTALESVRILQELEKGRAQTRALYDHLPNPMFVWRARGDRFVLFDLNEAARALPKERGTELIGRTPHEIDHRIPHLDVDLARCLASRSVVRRDVTCRIFGAEMPRELVLTYGFIPEKMVILRSEDVTEQRQTENRLVLMQRLEAIGRLAGGVAHDFNNLLSVIMSYSGFVLDELPTDDPIRADVTEILAAAERAASLTRQLLAFSRKQILEPLVLDLNNVVREIEAMLRRLLGEDIEIVVALREGLGHVMADPGQIEQVVMNLALNARDAMPTGGRLTIETANVELDEAYAAGHVAVKAGSYVRLAISDTGAGMDETTREHIFEPFFTTKAVGRGTGLGLSMVYGIVKQSGGNIWAYSEPGLGTTIKVYLPRIDSAPSGSVAKAANVLLRGGETVLLVEDEDAVRRLTERILVGAGYRVIAAPRGDVAIELYNQQRRGSIALLLTDVVMPQMSGRALAERISASDPTIRVLYMSGYTDNAIVHHGVLDADTHFIGKPFSAADLRRKVREVLDEDTARETD
ncbi:MAG: GAF domain-containing protein [Myxococcales bacterium]|nr:GAF domain-containing protein [Myxococcales bacterium]